MGIKDNITLEQFKIAYDLSIDSIKYYANKFHQIFLMSTTILGVTLVISSLFITNFIAVEPKNNIYYVTAIIWGLSLFSIIVGNLVSLSRCIEGLKIFEYKITDPVQFDKKQHPRSLMTIISKTVKNDYENNANIRARLKEKYDLALKSLEIALVVLAFFVVTSVMIILFIFVEVM